MPRVLTRVAGALGARAQRGVADMLREIITRSLMVMSLPGRVLYLGADMDEPVPAALAQLTDTELIALLGRFEPKPPVVDRVGARDWSDFTQRMHYIAHLFRAFSPARRAARSAVHARADPDAHGGQDSRRRAVATALLPPPTGTRESMLGVQGSVTALSS